MTSKEIFTGLINRINNNPMNSKKLYFTFTETVDVDKSTNLQIEFGVSRKKCIILKEFMSDGGDKNISEQRIYSSAIDKIFEAVYNRMADECFWNWQVAKNDN